MHRRRTPGATTATLRFAPAPRMVRAYWCIAAALYLAAVGALWVQEWLALALAATSTLVALRGLQIRRRGTWAATITPAGELVTLGRSAISPLRLHGRIDLATVTWAGVIDGDLQVQTATFAGCPFPGVDLLSLHDEEGPVVVPVDLLAGSATLRAALRTHTVGNTRLAEADLAPRVRTLVSVPVRSRY